MVILFCCIPATAPAAAGQEAAIVILGDSLSAAYGINKEAGWVNLLRQRLADGGYPHRVINSSISGDTTIGGVTRLPAVLDKYRPELLLIELGANDGLRGLGLQQTRENLERMIDLGRGVGSRVLLLGMMLPPNFGKAFTERFLQLFKDVAESKEVALVPFFLANVADRPERMQADGLHPNALGQPQMLEHVWLQLEPMLGPAAAYSAVDSSSSK